MASFVLQSLQKCEEEGNYYEKVESCSIDLLTSSCELSSLDCSPAR